MNDKHQYLLEKVSDWLENKGYRRARLPGKLDQPFHEPDGRFIKRGAPPLVVEARVINFYRSRDFRALVGDAILRHHHGKASNPAEDSLLLAVMMNRPSSKVQQDLQAYAQRYLPGLNWYVLDESGKGHACLNHREEPLVVREAFRHGIEGRSQASSGSIFSPGNQWLFKILLLAGIDRRYWGGPDKLPGNISELAEMSRVSQPAVSSFVMKAEKAGFLKRVSSGFVVLRHQDLLDEWFYVAKNRRKEDMGLRSLYGDEDPGHLVEKIRKYCRKAGEDEDVPPLVVSHHVACHLMKVGRSNVMFARLYANRPVEPIMAALDLAPDDSADPRLLLAIPPLSQSIRAGYVVCDGVPVCDILQCYLDVRSSMARGSEQAAYILDKILEPHFERNSHAAGA